MRSLGVVVRPRLIRLAGALLLLAAGCTRNGLDSGPEGTTTVRHLRVDGERRTFLLHVPPRYDALRNIPLVLMFHGHGGSADDFEHATGMSDKADREGFIVAYPQALGDPSDWHTGIDGPRTHDDVDFARAIISVISRHYRVDPRRVYAAGHSNGGIMVYRLASLLSDELAAVGVTAGTIGMITKSGDTVRVMPPRHPVSVIHFHGLADSDVPYRGGPESDGPDNVVSALNTVRFWAAVDHCPPRAPARSISADHKVIEDQYAPCADGTAVTLYTIVGGGHRWPGDDIPWWTLPDPLVSDLDATDVIWAFFATHPRRP